MMVLRGMRSAKVLMSCRSLWPTLEPQISMLGFILTLGTPPADRSTADCPLLLTVAAMLSLAGSSAACSQAPTWPCERIDKIAQRRSVNVSKRTGHGGGRPVQGAAGGRWRQTAVLVPRCGRARADVGARRTRMQRKIFARLRRALKECV